MNTIEKGQILRFTATPTAGSADAATMTIKVEGTSYPMAELSGVWTVEVPFNEVGVFDAIVEGKRAGDATPARTVVHRIRVVERLT